MSGVQPPGAAGVSQQNGSGSPSAARRQGPGRVLQTTLKPGIDDGRHILPMTRTEGDKSTQDTASTPAWQPSGRRNRRDKAASEDLERRGDLSRQPGQRVQLVRSQASGSRQAPGSDHHITNSFHCGFPFHYSVVCASSPRLLPFFSQHRPWPEASETSMTWEFLRSVISVVQGGWSLPADIVETRQRLPPTLAACGLD